MAKDINKKQFDETTKLKLDIFGECFEEWLPVFIHDRYTSDIYIFDFFAGSGKDIEDNLGSPLILLDKAKGNKLQYCSNTKKEINFIFNEAKPRKSKKLEENVINYIEECKSKNNCETCSYNYEIKNFEFKDILNDTNIKSILKNKEFGKFVILDQYGFKEVDDDIFRQLISFPKADFIFFITSSSINRFKKHPNIIKYIDTSKIEFDDPKEIHRAVTKYFRDLIPKGKEYYLHNFSIKKENSGNYYGLIFGSNHTLGMEKFLKVCWKHDKLSGEANYNIDDNFEKGTLFYEKQNIKKDLISKEIENEILSGSITSNIDGLKYAMLKGCEPKLFTEVVKKLEKNNKIERLGDKNYSSTNIHRVKKYKIGIKDET